jgi:hypothetical protein
MVKIENSRLLNDTVFGDRRIIQLPFDLPFYNKNEDSEFD